MNTSNPATGGPRSGRGGASPPTATPHTTAPTHPQPSIYETTVGDDGTDHHYIDQLAVRVRWTLDAANARVTHAMRDEGWTEADGVMVAPAKARRTRKAVAR